MINKRSIEHTRSIIGHGGEIAGYLASGVVGQVVKMVPALQSRELGARLLHANLAATKTTKREAAEMDALLAHRNAAHKALMAEQVLLVEPEMAEFEEEFVPADIQLPESELAIPVAAHEASHGPVAVH